MHKYNALRGVCSAVFRTTVLPHASAGPTFHAGRVSQVEINGGRVDTEHGKRKVPRNNLSADTNWLMHGVLRSV